MASKYHNTGQTCVCANRVLVQSSVHDAFVEKLTEAMKTLTLGNGFDEGDNQSALINYAALRKVVRHYNDAIGQATQRVAGVAPDGSNGSYVTPVWISGVAPYRQM